MMTLEEAIKHCKDVALSCTNKECALEHFQLLKWLQEYSNMLEKQGEQKSVEDLTQQEAMDIAVAKYFEQGEQKPNNQFTPKQADILDKHIDKFLEQKSADNVKPKFKVGDIIRHKKHGFTCKITAVDTEYRLSDCNGTHLPIEWQDAYELVEQNPADKIEPKFNVGDWVVSPNGVYWHIDKISNNRYEVTSNTGESSDWNLDTNIYHRFTIQDAKDGDVLVLNNEVFIYAHRKQMYSIAVAHCFVDSAGSFYLDGEFGYKEYGKTISPATKEQRDLLSQKMKEAGYEWNVKKRN